MARRACVWALVLVVCFDSATFAQKRAAKSSSKSSSLPPQVVALVDEAVMVEMQRQQLVGVAIGVIQHGRVVLTKGYGYADFENQVPVTTQTVFNWASNSKPLAAVAAMQLVEKNKLDLDADIRKYVPEFPYKGMPITARQLLCHQSGLPHWKNGRVVPTQDGQPPTDSLDPIVNLGRFSESPLLFPPGGRMSYSSYGYILLSAAIQRAGQEPFPTQIQKRIATPLGMKSLQLDVMHTNQANWAVGYTRSVRVRKGPANLGEVVRAPETAHAWKMGAGAFKSNIEDFARFAAALVNRRLVSKPIETEMWTPQRTTAGEVTRFGLGFVLAETAGGLTVGHDGEQTEGVSSLVLYLKPKDGIVVLCNCGNGNPTAISKAVEAALNAQ